MPAPSGRIAILGATSHLARDLIATSALDPAADLALFARHPAKVSAGFGDRFQVSDYETFKSGTYDAVINFVGAGDPARVAQMGRGILDVTSHFDQLVLDYLVSRPGCRYVFLSSGAVHGGNFEHPVDASTRSPPPSADDPYASAKARAERRHRALPHLAIVDLRVFSYFSRTLDVSTRFFLADVMRAICEGRTLRTTETPMMRDFLHPADFSAVIKAVLAAPPANAALDCYSLAPVDKVTVLETMRKAFGLDYAFVNPPAPSDRATGKQNYYSLNHAARAFGYQPAWSSVRCVEEEAGWLLKRHAISQRRA